MKNILKKFLLLFVIGMIGQTYIDDTCWALNPLEKYGFKTTSRKTEDKNCKSLEVTLKDWERLECPFNNIENFNPNNFFTDKNYIPTPKPAKHASRGGISFVEGIEKGKYKAITYISNKNFLAKSNTTAFNEGNNLTCRHDSFTKSENYPRCHSEIAFMQYLTELKDPANMGNCNFLNQFSEFKNCSEIIILIRNSKLPPCFWEKTGGKIDIKIKCLKYLTMLSGNLCDKTGKPVICIVSYDPTSSTFNSNPYDKCIKESKDKLGKDFPNVNVKIERINLEKNISKIIISVDKK